MERSKYKMDNLKAACNAYIAIALALDCESEGEGDENFSADDLAEETLSAMRADVLAFFSENRSLILDLNIEQVACDFWLSRNLHGAGFWDGDYDPGVGEKLNEAAIAFGEFCLYSQGGKVYFSR